MPINRNIKRKIEVKIKMKKYNYKAIPHPMNLVKVLKKMPKKLK